MRLGPKMMPKLMVAGAAMLLGSTVAVVTSEVSALPAGFEVSTELSGLQRPTSFKFSPDGRVFVAEHRGVVQVFDSLSDPTPTEVIDIRDQVHAVDGRGLLAVELDPNFPIDPYLYVLYTYDGIIGGPPSLYSEPGGNADECPFAACVASGRLSRLTLAGDVAVDETVLVEDWCQTVIHSVGDLAWGPDGELYASHGDGGFGGQPDYGQRYDNPCGNAPGPAGQPLALPDAEGGAMRAQDYQTSNDSLQLNGSIIRIDPDTGDGWNDNPNILSGILNERRLISHGFRNPFRMDVRPGTNEVWSGDVGWNTYEELNVIADPTAPVGNYGWPCYEGPDRAYDIGLTLCDNLYNDPAKVTSAYYAYRQNESLTAADTCKNTSGSITGLQFYEGGAYPEAYDGALFIADSSRECVWVMQAGPDGRPVPSTTETLSTGENIVDIELGPGGDVYMLSLLGDGDGGKIFRVAYPDGDVRPTARLSADVRSGPTDLAVAFNAGLSSPATFGDVLSYAWDLDGDGQFVDAPDAATASFTYTAEGRYVAQVRVTDQHGESDTAAVVITAGTPPVVTIDLPTGTEEWKVGDLLAYSGSATDNGEPLPESALEWELILHHCDDLDDCHIHPLGAVGGVSSGTFVAPEHEYPSFLEIVLNAADAAGVRSSDSVILLPQVTTLTADTDPPGLETVVNGERGVAPVTQQVIAGSRNTLTAPLGQLGPDDGRFEFTGWDDGGDATHDVIVGVDPATFTASYDVSGMPNVSVGDAFAAEVNKGSSFANFRLTLSYPSDKLVAVKVDTTDDTARRQDYFPIGNPARHVFKPGVTEIIVPVKIKNDPADEPTQTFFLDVVDVTNAGIDDGRGVGHIADNDVVPRLKVGDVSVKETDRTSFVSNVRLQLSAESQQPARALVSVVGGTAVPGVDFVDIPPTVIEWMDTHRVTLPITILGNDDAQPDRTIVLRFTDPEDLDIVDDEFVVTIVDDEPSITIKDATVVEGTSGVRRVRLSLKVTPAPKEAFSVNVNTVDGTATAGDDYEAVSSVIEFKRSQRSKTVLVDVFGDTMPEPDEFFEVVLSDSSGATIRDDRATVTIRSDDYVPDVSISDAQVDENGRYMYFTVSLSGPASKTVKVTYDTVDGTAEAPGDYKQQNNRVTSIFARKTERTIRIPVRNDSDTEVDETFEVVLSNPVNGVLADDRGLGTILDDD